MEYDNPVRRTASGNLVVGKEDGKIAGGSLFTSYYGGIRSSPEVNEVYFMGIIDILQVSGDCFSPNFLIECLPDSCTTRRSRWRISSKDLPTTGPFFSSSRLLVL
jgi:hypothetical protein